MAASLRGTHAHVVVAGVRVEHDRSDLAIVHQHGVAAVDHLLEGLLSTLVLLGLALGFLELSLEHIDQLIGLMERLALHNIRPALLLDHGLGAAALAAGPEAVEGIATVLYNRR